MDTSTVAAVVVTAARVMAAPTVTAMVVAAARVMTTSTMSTASVVAAARTAWMPATTRTAQRVISSNFYLTIPIRTMRARTRYPVTFPYVFHAFQSRLFRPQRAG